MIAAGYLVVVLGGNSEGSDPVGEYDGAGDATHAIVFRFDEGQAGTIEQNFYLRNQGDEPVTAERFDAYDDASLYWDHSDCGDTPTIAAGDECVVTAVWAPDSADSGFHEASLVLLSDDADRPELNLYATADKEKDGCSTASAAWSLWLAGLLLLRRRRASP
ncbi:MAG: hypothetical protein GY913_20305 [Proteobacteria bacterium]|nr:hypothetical protein [Pseudomonadota bacterium]MCP4919250.1 hypothetical protein [Pseudomonadota bacterium]